MQQILAGMPQLRERLRIKFFASATVPTIRGYIRRLAAEGWAPDLLVVDYLELVSPVKEKGDAYVDQASVAKALRALGAELEIPVVSATQSNRAAINAEVITQEHTADSLGKVRDADILISINRPDEDPFTFNGTELKVRRLYIAKNRNGPEHVDVPIATNTGCARFCEVMATLQLQAQLANQTPPPKMLTMMKKTGKIT